MQGKSVLIVLLHVFKMRITLKIVHLTGCYSFLRSLKLFENVIDKYLVDCVKMVAYEHLKV